MLDRLDLSTFTLLALLAPLAAQVPPGQYLTTVRTPNGEMYYVDTQTRKATQLTVSATITNDWANCVYMRSGSDGVIGTFNNPSVYQIKLNGTTVTETKLNTNALTAGAEIVQITEVGNTLYFLQGSAAIAQLWSMPSAGGTATMLLDMTTLTGWRSGGIPNALAATVLNLYMGVWTLGEVYEYNFATKQTKLLATLPNTKLPGSGFFPVNMQLKAPTLASTELVCCGLYGDIATIDTATGNLKSHYYAPSAIGTNQSNAKDSVTENTDTGDWVIGSRDGAIDVLVPVGGGQLARRDVEGIGSGANPNNNRVVAIWYNAVGADYKAYGAGCAGAGGYIPTSVPRGPAQKGNSGFGFGVDTTRSGTANALLVVGFTQSTLDLTLVGAPGCFLHTDIILLLGASATGAADGLGSGTLPAPIPASLSARLNTQWAIYDPTNSFGLVMSDARTLKL